MKRNLAQLVALSCLPTLATASCVSTPQGIPSTSTSVAPYLLAASLEAAKGNGRTLTVITGVQNHASYQVSNTQKLTLSSIIHLTVQLFIVTGAIEQPVLDAQGHPVVADLPRDYLGDPLTFRNLQNNTTYRIRCVAYSAAGTDPATVISDALRSYVDLQVGSEDSASISTIPVKLLDTVFGDDGSIGIADGRIFGTCPTAPPQSAMLTLGSSATAVQTLAGGASAGYADGFRSSALFNAPRGVATDNGGDLIVADTRNSVIRLVTSGGQTTTLAGIAGTAGFFDGPANQALFNSPAAVAVDSKGNTYVADTLNDRIRKIDTFGVVSTLAGGATGTPPIIDGKGGFAKFHKPSALAIDKNDVVYVGDGRWLRKVAPDGTVITIAGSGVTGYGPTVVFTQIEAIAFDSVGNLFFTDDNRVKELTNFGTFNVVAGDSEGGYVDGPAASAKFSEPYGIAVDGAGTLYVADAGNFKIRKVDSNRNVTTVAGSIQGFKDGGPGVAKFKGLANLTIIQGGLVVSENHAERLITFQ